MGIRQEVIQMYKTKLAKYNNPSERMKDILFAEAVYERMAAEQFNGKAKEEFNMKEYESRMVEELKELNEKIKRLRKFIGSDEFDMVIEREQSMLLTQLQSMRNYKDMLEMRCELHNISLKDLGVSK